MGHQAGVSSLLPGLQLRLLGILPEQVRALLPILSSGKFPTSRYNNKDVQLYADSDGM